MLVLPYPESLTDGLPFESGSEAARSGRLGRDSDVSGLMVRDAALRLLTMRIIDLARCSLSRA
ncbi:hypothetical protein X566_10035 [Afipia sp. P52-10]|nr:hypothetical protein X566_10035 [Afipia sp. P52-10]